jgi:hypothetical protein
MRNDSRPSLIGDNYSDMTLEFQQYIKSTAFLVFISIENLLEAFDLAKSLSTRTRLSGERDCQG